ncbi:MAG: hypothetical protein V2A34_00940 [Lentisphaerota bacterium]
MMKIRSHAVVALLIVLSGHPCLARAEAVADRWLTQDAKDADWRYQQDFAPACFMLTNLPAQSSATFEDARRLVESRILGSETNRLQLSAMSSLAVAGRARLMTWGKREITAPWEEYWLFFADDDPLANWAHPCRYIFVARDLSAIAVQQARTPLDNDLEVLIRFKPPPFVEAKMPFGARKLAETHHDGQVSNCHAVIISGGYTTNQNANRYWGDAAFLYSTLTLAYGYPKTNIYTYISDGTNPAVDALDFHLMDIVNSPADLDDDGQPDTLGEASAANISNVFIHLQGVLQSHDQLLVFVTDHGNHTAGGGEWDSELNLWGSDVIRDADLEALTASLPCPILFVMEQCYSGGFVDNITQPRRAIATATSHNRTSSGGNTFPFYDQWCYEWIAAMRGFYPVSNQPWANSLPCHGDLNGDGYVSFREASHYANARAPATDIPMYADHPDHFGSQLFLMQLTNAIPNVTDWVELAPFKTPPATNVPFEVRILARDQRGAVATHFSGPVKLEPVADIVNPGVTVGRADNTYNYLLRTDRLAGRTQIIIPSNMMGGARILDQLSLDVAVFPPQTLRRFTIRLRHSELEVYPMYPTQTVWESDWTTVYQKDRDIVSNGWATFVFTNAFTYDGVHHLMADFSFSNAFASESAQLAVGYDGVTTYRSLYRCSDGEFEDPLTWSGTNPAQSRTYLYPHLQFGPLPYQPQVAIVPSNLVDFTAGVWTGAIMALNAADNVRIFVKTTNSYWDTVNVRFPIREYLFDLSAPQPAPDGTCRLSWGSGTGYTYRIAISSNLLAGYHPAITHLPATPPLNTYTAAVGGAAIFFRVEEE